MESLERCEAKLQTVLDTLIDPCFELKSDVYLNKLLSYVEGKHDAELGSQIRSFSFIPAWLIHVVHLWETTNVTPKPPITSFIIQLTSILSRDEANFARFAANNLHLRLCAVLRLRNAHNPPSVKIAYIRMLNALLPHRKGLEWTMATDNWQDVLKFYVECQTIYIEREGREYIYNLVANCIDYNQVFCSLVIEKIISHLDSAQLHEPELDKEMLENQLLPIFTLILDLLEHRIKRKLAVVDDTRIPTLFKQLNFDKYLYKYFSMAQTEKLAFVISDTITTFYFAMLVSEPDTKLFSNEDILTGIDKIIVMFKYDISKGYTDNVFRRLYSYLKRWYVVHPHLHTEDTVPKEISEFTSQIAVIQFLPIVLISYRHCEVTKSKVEEDSIRDLFTFCFFKELAESTIRSVYSWKEFLLEKTDIFAIACKSISHLMKSRKYFPRKISVVGCQLFIYVLKDVVEIMEKKPETVEVFRNQPVFFKTLLHALVTFIDEYKITWRESVETICLMKLGLEFLSYTKWHSGLVVHTLKVVNVSIANFLTPNLALLVEHDLDSSMIRLAPILTEKLLDEQWEVRDSALEVLRTISEISHTKFPGFQPMVLKAQFPQKLVAMATSDAESFVRASAIQCLAQMIKVPNFWHGVLDQEHLPSKMMSILLDETEGIVRREACSLMCRIYEHQQFPLALHYDVYKVMTHAATADLHWEVKVNAFDFWRKLTLNRLAHQGMIDGTFPNVTFSSEHRKIVTLTPNEVRMRLSKVLMELSGYGCLGVFVACLHDADDVQVVERTVEFLRKCAQMLRQYNLTTVDEISPVSPKNVARAFPFPYATAAGSSASGNGADEASERDLSDVADVKLLTEGLSLRIMPAQEYLDVVMQDLDAILREKRDWLRSGDSLQSLLEDILRHYNEDVNVMDCY